MLEAWPKSVDYFCLVGEEFLDVDGVCGGEILDELAYDVVGGQVVLAGDGADYEDVGEWWHGPVVGLFGCEQALLAWDEVYEFAKGRQKGLFEFGVFAVAGDYVDQALESLLKIIKMGWDIGVGSPLWGLIFQKFETKKVEHSNRIRLIKHFSSSFGHQNFKICSRFVSTVQNEWTRTMRSLIIFLFLYTRI